MIERSIRTINDNFGSKRGLVKYAWYKLLTGVGYFNKYSEVDWTRVARLVFVCHGNICRSSLAEGVARSLGANAISLGTACRDGAGADPRAIAFADSIAIDLTAHRSQNLTNTNITAQDLIVVMEPAHIPPFEEHLAIGAQLTLAGLWDSEKCAYIHDPYSANEVFFSHCESRVAAAGKELATCVR